MECQNQTNGITLPPCPFTAEKKSPAEAKGDCTICKGWVNDGRGGTCVFTDDFWTPHCPYDKEAKQ